MKLSEIAASKDKPVCVNLFVQEFNEYVFESNLFWDGEKLKQSFCTPYGGQAFSESHVNVSASARESACWKVISTLNTNQS